MGFMGKVIQKLENAARCTIKYNIWNTEELYQTTDHTTNKTVILVIRVRILLLLGGREKIKKRGYFQRNYIFNAISHCMILHFLLYLLLCVFKQKPITSTFYKSTTS